MLSRCLLIQEALENLDKYVEEEDVERSDSKYVTEPVNHLIETVLVAKKIKRQLHVQ